MNRYSLKQHLVEGPSHMMSHYTWGSVTTLHDFGGVVGWPLDTFFWALTISWSHLLARVWSGPNIRATSLTKLKAHDHCNLRALIGRKGGDRPSSLHTRRWRPKEDFMDEKSTWSPTWQTMDKVSWSPGIFVRPTSKRWAWSKFRETMIFWFFFSMTNFRTNFGIDPRIYYKRDSIIDKHHQVVLSNWSGLRHIILNQNLPSFFVNEICNGPGTWSILTSHLTWGSVTT